MSGNNENMAKTVQELFIEKGWTLAVAESCTGGALSAMIVKVPGASDYFLGGVIAYSNALKKKVLMVSDEVLQQNGAVSQEAAEAMLMGLFQLTECDFGVAVTGIAGPDGGTKEKPVGTVWIAVGKRGKTPLTKQLKLTGNRCTIIDSAVTHTLKNLLEFASLT